ncbi:MAG: hypothetical protein HY044_03010 [Candidatus Woesebacteria bacterium]|nr:MAG: hypothetical protein HY044_03010 [Candidatus Woesebacteria bacterium]
MKKYKTDQIEIAIYRWIIRKRVKIILSLIAIAIIYLFSILPYFNILISKEMVYLIITIIVILIFGLKSQTIFKITVLLLFLTFFLVFIKRDYLAELVGDVVFVLFALGIFMQIFKNNEK